MQFYLVLVICCINLCHTIDNERILSWWRQISVQKPMKCKTNPDFLKPLPPMIAKKIIDDKTRISIIQSKPCQEKDQNLIFDFKGKKSNGKLEGPGKLNIKKRKQNEKHMMIG